LRRGLSALSLLGLALALAAGLAALLAGPGHRMGWWGWRTGFQTVDWAGTIGMWAAFLSILGGLFALIAASWRRALAAFLGVAIGFGVMGVPKARRNLAQRHPPIHDITTDTERPPEFRAILPLRKGALNPPAYAGARVADLQKKGYPDLKPAVLSAPPDEVFRQAQAAARSLGWTVVAALPDEGRIEATDRTFWFGFTDDIVIRIRPEGDKTRLDIRSKSRVGGSDLGTNAKRVRAFLAALADRMSP